MLSPAVTESIVAELNDWAVSHASLWLETLRDANADPEDVAQFAWQQFLRAGPTELPASEPDRRRVVKRWLEEVISNKAVELQRQLVRRKAYGGRPRSISLMSDWSEIAPATRSAYTKAVSKERAAEIRAAIASLDAQQQEVVLLRAFEGRKHAEIADELGISAANARQIYARARAVLATRLRGELVAMMPGDD